MKTLVFKSALTIFLTFMVIALYGQLQTDASYWRPYDQRGINMFEEPNVDTIGFEGVRVRIGGAFAQQFQALSHSNEAEFVDDGNGGNANELYALSNGFNLATANLNIDAQLADGVRLNLVTYLSSRHHPEAWVKGGYIQFDKLAFLNSELIDNIMTNLRIRVGHMEVNYGDQHFRRTDNGNALYNPFVGNYIMDAFNTEIGAEIYYVGGNILGMVGITGGEINGNVAEVGDNPNDDKAKRSPTILGKVGFDNGLNGAPSGNVRFRVTGSVYYTASSARNHLYTGDRGGSRYYLVMEQVGARAGSDFRSGRYSPNFGDEVTAFQINPFVKFGGLEFFGTFEMASGKSNFEPDRRSATQLAGELLYRFGAKENVFVGARYNTISSEDSDAVPDGDNIGKVNIDRLSFAAGWFITRNIVLKAEYVNQNYKDYVETSRFHEGNFNGLMIEAVVGF